MINQIKRSIDDGIQLVQQFSENSTELKKIEVIAQQMVSCFQNGNKIIICGNGGSACDAMHFSEEFTGRFRKDRKALTVISLTDASHITCVGNDYGFDYVFSRGVEAYGKPGDIFIGLSTSGMSKNVINAYQEAKKLGLHTCLFLGKDGGDLAGRADAEFVIPGKTSDRIQEVHMMILHIIIEMFEREMFGELYG